MTNRMQIISVETDGQGRFYINVDTRIAAKDCGEMAQLGIVLSYVIERLAEQYVGDDPDHTLEILEFDIFQWIEIEMQRCANKPDHRTNRRHNFGEHLKVVK